MFCQFKKNSSGLSRSNMRIISRREEYLSGCYHGRRREVEAGLDVGDGGYQKKKTANTKGTGSSIVQNCYSLCK